MKILKPVLSASAPNFRDALWLKPVAGGFVPYVFNGGAWVTQAVAQSDNDTDNTESVEDIKDSLIGSVQDDKGANTINGAKAYAKALEKSLKDYVDEKVAGKGKKQ